MKLKKTICSILSLSFILFGISSCLNEEDMTIPNQQETSQIIHLVDKEIKNINGTLSFTDIEEVKEIADNLISFTSTKSENGILIPNYNNIKRLKENGFISLYDVFENAMNDVDLYYNKEGGYEEFKGKYSSLFFPEEGNDISPYLPIRDKRLAMLADTNGDVLIANQKVSLKDITTYQQLKDLGQTPPEGGISTTAERGDVIYGINSIPETKVGGNKVWVKTHSQKKDGAIPIIQVEVCFRKKYLLGWSNHNSNTTAQLNGSGGLQMYTGKDHESTVSTHGFSSHDYFYAIPTVKGSPYTVNVNQNIVITHGGTGLILNLTCQVKPYIP